MGKSTTALMFQDEGIPTWDADGAVHRLYSKGGGLVEAIRERFPSAIIDDAVSRPALKGLIAADAKVLKALERIVHPSVTKDRAKFLSQVESDIALVDIPLLFESGGDAHVDIVVVCSAPPDVQKTRVLGRPGMTCAQFEAITANQLPDQDKRARADYVIETVSLDIAREQVVACLADIRAKSGQHA